MHDYPVGLVQMSDKHLANTLKWLSQSVKFRQQIDCLQAPTEEGNCDYWRSNWQDPLREDYAIVTDTGVHIGNCGLRNLDIRRKKAELWIYLGESRSTGKGGWAIRQLLIRAFDVLKLNRVYLRVLADNHRAMAFYSRLGFIVEGCNRDDTVSNGAFLDSIAMALLEKDYRCRTQNSMEMP